MQHSYGLSLTSALETQKLISPAYSKFLDRRLSNADLNELAFLDEIAALIFTLFPKGIEVLAKDYAWLCEQQVEEELYFRRNKSYRLTTFQEALKQVYSDQNYMTRYMNGLLMTQLWWSNHTAVMQYYANSFLKSLKPGSSVLEIGPGHGLLSYMAGESTNCARIECWDISSTSIEQTRHALKKLSISSIIDLRLVDLFDAPEGNFDAVIFCEILEHMEHPKQALEKLRKQLAPMGKVFINMPINSPAPDHLFNQSTPEDLAAFVEMSGLKIIDYQYFPATNYSLQRARDKKLTINCVFVAEAA